MRKLTPEQISKWTDNEFQQYRLWSWNASHQKKLPLKSIPTWYMFSKEALIKSIKGDK
ncbi:MAG: hypothetical protein LBL60_01385 [Mycoplasmataceae bacterium]|nr:hypothetical protein [Mycoplasmataceae bacterium]